MGDAAEEHQLFGSLVHALHFVHVRPFQFLLFGKRILRSEDFESASIGIPRYLSTALRFRKRAISAKNVRRRKRVWDKVIKSVETTS